MGEYQKAVRRAFDEAHDLLKEKGIPGGVYGRVKITVSRHGRFIAEFSRFTEEPFISEKIGAYFAGLIARDFPAGARPLTIEKFCTRQNLRWFSGGLDDVRLSGMSCGVLVAKNEPDTLFPALSTLSNRLEALIPPSNQPLRLWCLGYAMSGMRSVSDRGIYARSQAEAALRKHVITHGEKAIDAILETGSFDFLPNLGKKWFVAQDVRDDPREVFPVPDDLDDDLETLNTHLASLSESGPEP